MVFKDPKNGSLKDANKVMGSQIKVNTDRSTSCLGVSGLVALLEHDSEVKGSNLIIINDFLLY